MKNYFIHTLLALCFSVVVVGQEEERPNIIQLDSTWGKELFTFPLGFAQEIKYQGFEEARFPKGWNDTESPYFWTYVFAWNLDHDTMLTAHELEINLQHYFNGVMSLNIERKTHPDIQDTSAVFLQKEGSDRTASFIGKIRTWDHFTTKKPITLYAQVEQTYCIEQQKLMVLFRFSPKSFTDTIWQSFGTIALQKNICEH